MKKTIASGFACLFLVIIPVLSLFVSSNKVLATTACGQPVCIGWDAATKQYSVENDVIKAIWNYDHPQNVTPKNQSGGNIYYLYYKPLDPEMGRNLVANYKWGTDRSGIFTAVPGLGHTDMYATTAAVGQYSKVSPTFDDLVTDNNAYSDLQAASATVQDGNAILFFSYKMRNSSTNPVHWPGGVKDGHWYQIDKTWTVHPDGTIDLDLKWTLLHSGYISEPGIRTQFDSEAGWDRFVKYGHNWDETSPRAPYLFSISGISKETSQSWDHLNMFHPDWVALTGSEVAPTVVFSAVGGFDATGSAELCRTTDPYPNYPTLSQAKSFTMEQGTWIANPVGAQAIGYYAWWGGNPPSGNRYRYIDALVPDPNNPGQTVYRSWIDHFQFSFFHNYDELQTSTLAGGNSPEITQVAAQPGANGLTRITWKTDVPSDSFVDVDNEATSTISWIAPQQADRSVGAPDAPFSTEHTVDVTLPSGTYKYRVKSRDAVGNLSIDANNKLKLPADPVAPAIYPSVDYRVSTDANMSESNWTSKSPAISDDGRYIAFSSRATDLVPEDINNKYDIFVKDTVYNTIVRISRGLPGSEIPWQNLAGDSYSPSISADGRYVAFSSQGKNLVENDNNEMPDVFVREVLDESGALIEGGQIMRVSTRTDGLEATDNVNPAETRSGSITPSISDEGNYVAFTSSANNLVSSDTNIGNDIFVKEIGRDANGSMTGNGMIVRASTKSATGEQATYGADGSSANPSISADGRFVAFESSSTDLSSIDTRGTVRKIFRKEVKDSQNNLVETGELGMLSVGWDDSRQQIVMGNGSFNAAISGDGQHVAFTSWAYNLVPEGQDSTARCFTSGCMDVFVRDISAGTTRCLTCVGTAHSNTYPSLSGDGRYVAFSSAAPNLVPNDRNARDDIFLKDMDDQDPLGSLLRLNVDMAAKEAQGGGSMYPSISSAATDVVFQSLAPNLMKDDANGAWDIFNVSIDVQSPEIVSISPVETIKVTPTSVTVSYHDPSPSSGINGAAVTLDGIPLTGCVDNQVERVECPVSELPEGSHTVNAQVTDNAGNTATATSSFLLDTAAPELSVAPSGIQTAFSTTITGAYSDSGADITSGIDTASVQVVLDGNTVASCTVTAESVNCPAIADEGPHSYTVSVSDLAGNTRQSPGAFTVDVLNRSEVVVIDDQGQGCTLPLGVWDDQTTTCVIQADFKFAAGGLDVKNNVTIDGAQHMIMGAGSGSSYAGVQLFNRKNVTIKNLKIGSFGHGLSADRSSGILVQGSHFEGNGFGIYATYTSINIQSDNTFNGNGTKAWIWPLYV